MDYSELCTLIRNLDKKDQVGNFNEHRKELKYSCKKGGEIYRKELNHKPKDFIKSRIV